MQIKFAVNWKPLTQNLLGENNKALQAIEKIKAAHIVRVNEEPRGLADDFNI
ncbi:hypothetical protein J5288_28215 [Agrobacterium sp. S2/73]|uniref:hypothetical protein n=1 Tax=unclassified Agrobacterium TaxID=2632611 RepID=UPI001AD9E7CC|nr:MULTISPECIES: hypothetical protein [unclassified Agrobacterium]MBO9112545.1 hypothetical protein [Agrobacterium sp. S2/73]QXZ76047.1 hypothetical protein J5276_28685 [Agrobacterium sp. S7/73]